VFVFWIFEFYFFTICFFFNCTWYLKLKWKLLFRKQINLYFQTQVIFLTLCLINRSIYSNIKANNVVLLNPNFKCREWAGQRESYKFIKHWHSLKTTQCCYSNTNEKSLRFSYLTRYFIFSPLQQKHFIIHLCFWSLVRWVIM